MNCNNEWLEIEILTGLQKLSCLSLDRTPAAEMLPGTAQAWLEAITDGKAWDERRDADRIAAAFRTLARTARRWPLPAEFLDALPKVEQQALGYEVKPTSPEEAAKILDRLRREVESAPPLEAKPPVRMPHVDLAAAEQELRQHYGKAAAAGPDA